MPITCSQSIVKFLVCFFFGGFFKPRVQNPQSYEIYDAIKTTSPVTDWKPVQGVPCLTPKDPAYWTDGWMKMKNAATLYPATPYPVSC